MLSLSPLPALPLSLQSVPHVLISQSARPPLNGAVFTKTGGGLELAQGSLLTSDLRPWSLDGQCPAAEGGERSRRGLE